MVDIIRLNDDPHSQSQQLLPWYVTGTLGAAETALVEGHLTECAECREDLEMEQGLARQIKALPGDADSGWAGLKARLVSEQPGNVVKLPRRHEAGRWSLGRAAGLAIAASIVTFLLVRSPPVYRTLSAPPGAAAGNVVVIFRPDASEAALRAVLTQNRARIVDGPTAADAYVLHVADGERAAILARLKGDRSVSVAEPIDGDVR